MLLKKIPQSVLATVLGSASIPFPALFRFPSCHLSLGMFTFKPAPS